ncbi:silencing defective protein Sde2 [Mactra antiquata]
MATFVHSFSSRHIICIDHANFSNIGELKRHLTLDQGIEPSSCFLVCNGNIVDDSDPVKKDVVYHTYLRLPGGKGGFGSMLRAIGAQIEKTTNHEACRDLSGRRMRDINNEKDLKEWLGKQAEREREKELKRQERIARRRAMPNHKFSDPLYDEQKALLAEMQDDALQTGIKKVFSKPGPSCTATSEEPGCSKRKMESGPSSSGAHGNKKRKATEWLGMDIDNLSDLDDSDEDNISDNKSTETGSANTISDDSNSKHSDDYLDKNSGGSSDNKDDTTDSSERGDNEGVSEKSGSSSETVGDISDIKKDNEGGEKSETMEEIKPFNLDEVTCVKDLEILGLDRLKQELMDRGLKCGGTLEDRAERLFSVKGLTKDQIDPSLFAKSAGGKKVKNKK